MLGILGLLMALIPFLFWLSFPIAAVGVVLAIVGRSRSKRGEATNGGAAMVGVITSVVALVISVLWPIAFFAWIAGNDDFRACLERTAPENAAQCDRYLN